MTIFNRALSAVTVFALTAVISLPGHSAVIDSGGGQFVWTDLVGSSSPVQANGVPGGVSVLMSGAGAGDFGGSFSTGDRIHISRIAIGGDSRATSGDNRFRLVSGGGSTDFTWVAGQQATPADFRLAPTPEPGDPGPGTSTGFSYFDVDFTLDPDEAFQVFWDYHVDYDGRFTRATDVLGNFFDDFGAPEGGSTIRAWVQMDIVSAEISEPVPLSILAAGLTLLAIRRRHR